MCTGSCRRSAAARRASLDKRRYHGRRFQDFRSPGGSNQRWFQPACPCALIGAGDSELAMEAICIFWSRARPATQTRRSQRKAWPPERPVDAPGHVTAASVYATMPVRHSDLSCSSVSSWVCAAAELLTQLKTFSLGSVSGSFATTP